MFQNLSIFEKTYEMILWLYPTINKFPKSQRFVLGQQIETAILEILKGIIQANSERDKIPYLKQMSVELDKLRILIRLSKDLKFINIKQYQFVVEKINEVGKMLGGWIKSCRQSIGIRIKIIFILFPALLNAGRVKSRIEPAFKRGGNWNNGSNAGAFTLNLNNLPSNSDNNNIGFRCARYFSIKTRPEQNLYGDQSEPRRLRILFFSK